MTDPLPCFHYLSGETLRGHLSNSYALVTFIANRQTAGITHTSLFTEKNGST